MPSTPEPHEQWYVLHVLSGQENSVRDRIIRKAKEDGIDTIVTCDNGIAALEQVRLANLFPKCVTAKKRNVTANSFPGTFMPTCTCWKRTAP